MAFVLRLGGARRPRTSRAGVGRTAPREADEDREDGGDAEHDDDPGDHLVRVVVEPLVQQVLVEVVPRVRPVDALRVQRPLALVKLLQGLHRRRQRVVGGGGWVGERAGQGRSLVERDAVVAPVQCGGFRPVWEPGPDSSDGEGKTSDAEAP